MSEPAWCQLVVVDEEGLGRTTAGGGKVISVPLFDTTAGLSSVEFSVSESFIVRFLTTDAFCDGARSVLVVMATASATNVTLSAAVVESRVTVDAVAGAGRAAVLAESVELTTAASVP